MNPIEEPPINPDDDTSPSLAMRPVDVEPPSTALAPWRRVLGWLSLLGALGFTVATLVVLLLPAPAAPAPDEEPDSVLQAPSTVPPTTTVLPTIPPTEAPVVAQPDELPPAVAPAQFEPLLNAPLESDSALARPRYIYEPFTIVRSDRPRSEFIEYTAAQGDTINEIALRFNLEPESIAWCNNRRIVLVLRPGDVLNIPPVDGACHRVLGTREETLASIAEQYGAESVYDIIDSPYNPLLYGADPNAILPGGAFIFIPGGQGEVITWNPGRDVEESADGQVVGVTFAPGQAGSCGRVVPGGGAYWTNPLPNGTWVRGFYPGHSGIDLAASVGTPVFAANSGNVLFSGWSNWGYGNTVVLEHGGTLSTLYGHMSQVAVGCGQFVNAGQIIGYVGSTGNSSGPHLHFEIRSGDTPTDPTATAGIGW